MNSATRRQRTEHCIFARLNANGKCIAHCFHNFIRDHEDGTIVQDCTGKTGRTMDTDGGREAQITGSQY